MMILEARALTFAYPGREQVLSGVDFTVNKGEFVGLVGANGCGKTTLFQQFNGLLKPGTGTVFLHGKALNEWRKEEIFQRVGLVFQDPNDQLFAATVYDDVSYGPANLRLAPAEISGRVQQALEQVGMSEYRKRSLHELSYGQKKRVAIAGILAMEPEIIILDEPTAGLDPRTASSLLALLKSLQKDRGLTIILSTHEVDIVPIYCDRVYVMENGAIMREGTPSEVFAEPEKIRQAYLRLPRVAHLVEILQRDGSLNMDSLPLTIGQARKLFEHLTDGSASVVK